MEIVIDQGGGTDAISLQESSVTWVSGLFLYRCSRVSTGVRGTSDHSLRQSLDQLFTANGRVQKGLF